VEKKKEKEQPLGARAYPAGAADAYNPQKA